MKTPQVPALPGTTPLGIKPTYPLYLPVVKLTKAQTELVQWAADAMLQYWANEVDEAERIDNVIQIFGTTCHIARNREVLSDLKYRLIEQFPGVVEDEAPRTRTAQIRVAEAAWDRIEAVARAAGLDEIEAK